jgi:tripartite-type tricarboxylate transporter receptor subunit TctC
MFRLRKFAMGLATLGLAASITHGASAQEFPNRAMKIVVPAAAGGPTYVTAQLIADKMQASLGQPVILEARAGGGSNIGAEFVARSAPDGYTLLFNNIGTHAINKSLFKKLPFDPVKDFEPISQAVQYPLLLVVNNDVPVKSVAELIAYAKKHPGKLNRASSGVGTSMHLSGEMFVRQAGIDMPHIAYKGSAPALNDMLGGHVQVMFDSMITSVPLVESGKLRALAVTGKNRSALLPDVPTIAESGLPGFEAAGWTGVAAPAGTPRSVIERLNAAIVQALRSPELQDAFRKLAAEPVGSTPEEFGTFMRNETDKWAAIVKNAGITAE